MTEIVRSLIRNAVLHRLANLESDVAELLRSRRLVLPVGQQPWPSFWITGALLASTSITFLAMFALRFSRLAGGSGR